jgi:hypothetical protein
MRRFLLIASAFAAGLVVGALGAGLAAHPGWLVSAAPDPEAAAARKQTGEEPARREEAEARRRREVDARHRLEEDLHRERDEKARRTAGVSCDHAAPALKGAFADCGDCTFAQRALILALTTARDGAAASTWSNARSGVSGTVQIFYTTQESDGTLCRRFQQTVVREGREISGVATACFRNNAWHIVG